MIRQEESRSVSENCKWRIRKQFEEGEIVNWRFMFGYRNVGRRMEIDSKEAEVVRSVFNHYINGESTASIARRLQGEGVPIRFGGQWSVRRIIDMILNEKYTGNARLQKYVSDHLTKVLTLNRGQLPMYYAEDTQKPLLMKRSFDRRKLSMSTTRKKLQQKVRRLSVTRLPYRAIIPTLCFGCPLWKDKL